jgi:membrane protein DedA with SNARE-associated domain
VHRGRLALVPTLACAFLGTALGVTAGFVLGHVFGLYLLKRFGPRLGVTAERLERVHAWFRRVGKWGLLFGYFLPGIRHLNGLLAGSAKLEFPVFACFAYAGGLLWTASFILAGVLLGEGWSRLPAREQQVLLVLAAVAAVVGLGIVLFRRGRRRPASSSER